MYSTSPQLVARAVAVAAVIAVAVGVAWAYQPAWSFWFAIGGAFAIAEAMVRVTGAKRGSTYQMIGMIAVLACIVICRVVLVHRLGLSLGDIGNILNSSRIDSPRSRALFNVLALDIPNFVYIALALAIPYVRFR
ncbi:MAG: hypothetical protein ACR2JW_14025 [Thermomicrobiales bacterium]